jgi:hypothetical protein
MDRRTFVTTGVWLSASACAWPWMARAADASYTIAVLDTNLASARAFADYLSQRQMPAFEVGDDIGTLWYATLAPRLNATPGQLIGFTRASDYFVLGQLAAGSGRKIERASDPGGGWGAPVAFLIGPTAPHPL